MSIQNDSTGAILAGASIQGASKRTALGYLRALNGDLYDLTDSQVKGLLEDVKPDGFDGNIPFWDIDNGGEVYTKSYPSPNTCVYDATKRYMESLGIGTLTDGDKDFFKYHPRVTDEGVGRANVLSVVQGLVVPWGLGISRIWMPKNTSLGDQHVEFATQLGINPLAITDSSTTNSECLEKLGVDKDSDIGKQILGCRFEFADRPTPPCIVMLNSSSAVAKGRSGNATWGSNVIGLGHATFLGPRDFVSSGWVIAFRLDRNPQYADDSLSRYGDLSSFGQENEAKGESLKSLSVGQSKVRGKTVTSYSRFQTPRNVGVGYTRAFPDSAKSPDRGNGGTGGNIHQFAKSSSKLAARLVSYGICPMCGKLTREQDGSSMCLSCNWFSTEHGDADTVRCPFCDSRINSDGSCRSRCGYNSDDWHTSVLYRCQIHKTRVYYHFTDEENKLGIYACPRCLSEKHDSLTHMMENNTSHGIEELPKDEK